MTPAARGGRRRRAHKRAPRRRATVILLVGMALIVVVVGLSLWVAVRAVLARDELDRALPLAGVLQRQVLAGDDDGVRGTALELAERAASAAALTGDPVWRVFEALPVLGANLAVARQLAAVTDDLARDGIVPLAEVAGGLSVEELRPGHGGIDVQQLVAAQPAIAGAATALRVAETRIDRIHTDGTHELVAGATARLGSAVGEAELAVDAVDRAVRILPAMLGSNGPRNYLLLFQNPAELRSTGGIVGAVALIHTDNGAIHLTRQASGASFLRRDAAVLDLPADTVNLYGERTGQYMLNVGLTPRFPLSARLAQELWQQDYGDRVDGVLSVDPVALGYILAATGPITLPSGDVLSSANAVDLLLTEVYERFAEPADQDAFFAAAAVAVFSAVAGGDVDPVKLITALGKAGGERRVLVWSAAAAEQAVLADTTLAGSLPVSDDEVTRFGLYLNDATGAKMDAHLDVRTSVGQQTCRGDGRPNYVVEVKLTNTAPSDAATSLPRYVTGGGLYGVPAGNIRTIVSAYGGPEMQNLGLTRDGEVVPYLPATDDGYQVSALTLELGPGESTVVEYGWLGPSPAAGVVAGAVELQMTPHMHTSAPNRLELSC